MSVFLNLRIPCSCLLLASALTIAHARADSADKSLSRPDPSGKPQAHLALGSPAPEILATTPDGNPASLAGLRSESPDKLLVLQFGSFTDPIFRTRAPAVEKLATRYADKAAFVIIYSEESHPADSPDALELNKDGFNIAQPTTLAERQKLAQQTVERLSLKHQKMLVDAWNNTSALRYGSYPNMTFIIDKKGDLQAGYPWMDPTKVGAALDALLAGKPLSPDLKGSVKPSGPAPLDSEGMAMEMTGGGRGPGAVGAALDKMKLTDAQRKAIYPALAEYFVSLQTFRQTMNNAPPGTVPPGRGRGGRGANRAGNQQAAAPKDDDAKVVTPEEVQSASQSLHASAEKLKTAIKQNLGEKDAAELLSTLNRTNAQRLFANP